MEAMVIVEIMEEKSKKHTVWKEESTTLFTNNMIAHKENSRNISKTHAHIPTPSPTRIYGGNLARFLKIRSQYIKNQLYFSLAMKS